MKFELLLASVAASTALAPQDSTAGGGLVRVPAQSGPDRAAIRLDSGSQSAEEPFEPAHWQERLSARDLDQRMFAFEQLGEQAAADPSIRAQLEAWSRGADELAWTARLLLRDLESGGPRAAQRPRRGLWRIEPFSAEPWADLERRLDELWKLHDSGRGLWSLPAPGGGSSSQSTQVEVGPQGVKVRVTEEVDGQPTTREYSAASLDELLAAHPELRGRIGVGGAAPSGPMFGPRFDWFLRDPRGGAGPDPTDAMRRTVRTDILGVVLEELSAEQRRDLGVADGIGLRIARVESGTIAERLGLKSGHILLELDGQAVRSRDDVTARIRAREKSAEVRAVYLDRWGQRHEARWREQDAREI